MTEPKWLLVEIAYLAVVFALFGGAYKLKSEWGRACLGALAVAILGWRTLAVVPSWWLYYADGVLGWGGQGCAKIDVSCLKQSLKDTVVVIENAAVLGGFVVAFMMYQKRFPKQLAPGEAKGETIGGYK